MQIFRNLSSNLHRDGAPAIETPFLRQWWVDGKLHRSDGPAVVSTLGTEQYFWKGVNLDKILFCKGIHRQILVKEILENENTELRRILIEMYGFENLIRDSVAKTVDVDLVKGSTLYEIPLKKDEPVVILQVLDSTPVNGIHKKYFLRVPPSIRSCSEAVAWTFDLESSTYLPEQES